MHLMSNIIQLLVFLATAVYALPIPSPQFVSPAPHGPVHGFVNSLASSHAIISSSKGIVNVIVLVTTAAANATVTHSTTHISTSQFLAAPSVITSTVLTAIATALPTRQADLDLPGTSTPWIHTTMSLWATDKINARNDAAAAIISHLGTSSPTAVSVTPTAMPSPTNLSVVDLVDPTAAPTTTTSALEIIDIPATATPATTSVLAIVTALPAISMDYKTITIPQCLSATTASRSVQCETVYGLAPLDFTMPVPSVLPLTATLTSVGQGHPIVTVIIPASSFSVAAATPSLTNMSSSFSSIRATSVITHTSTTLATSIRPPPTTTAVWSPKNATTVGEPSSTSVGFHPTGSPVSFAGNSSESVTNEPDSSSDDEENHHSTSAGIIVNAIVWPIVGVIFLTVVGLVVAAFF